MAAITLDPAIRDWVLLPLTAIVICVFLLRTLLMQFLQQQKSMSDLEIRHKGLVARSQRTRAVGRFIEPSGFLHRKKELGAQKGKWLLDAKPEMPPSNPMSMMSGMASQPVMMLSTIGLGYLINTLFSGFVLVRLPFPMTARFRIMTQRDIDLAWLDPSYVSSFSWYILIMYGARPLLTLVMGAQQSDALIEAQTMGGGMMAAGNPMAAFNPKQAFQAEAGQLKLAQYGSSATAAVEQSLLKDDDAASTPVSPEDVASKAQYQRAKTRSMDLLSSHVSSTVSSAASRAAFLASVAQP